MFLIGKGGRCCQIARMKLPSLLLLLISGVLCFLPSCRSLSPAPAVPHPPLPTVAKVDLAKYAGSWFEVSRLPNFFQKSCVRSMAEYTALPDGTVQVRNTCYKAKGRTSSVTGTATPVEGSGNARLKVKFGGLASLAPVPEKGNYWVIALDPQYRWAMVGTPDRKFLWMLARQPQLPYPVYLQLKTQAKSLGFDITRLLPEASAPPGLAALRKTAPRKTKPGA